MTVVGGNLTIGGGGDGRRNFGETKNGDGEKRRRNLRKRKVTEKGERKV